MVLRDQKTLKQELALAEMANKLAQLKMSINAANLRVSKLLGRSFAHVAGIKSATVEEFSVPPTEPYFFLTKEESREDYLAAEASFQKQREDCYAIACAMAERRAVVSVRRYSRSKKTLIDVFSKCMWVPAIPHLPQICGNKLKGEIPIKKSLKAQATSVKQLKKRQRPTVVTAASEAYYSEERPRPPPPCERKGFGIVISQLSKTFLGQNLCEGLLTVMGQRKGLDVPKMFASMRQQVEPQMNRETPTGDPPSKVDQRGNTIISENANIDKDSTHPSRVGFQPYAVSVDKRVEDSTRWLVIDTFKWDSDKKQNDIVFEITLPLDFITKNLDSVSMNEVLTNRFIKSDIRIKVRLNCHPFALGCMKVDFIPGKLIVEKLYTHIGSVVQRPHITLSCSQSNDGEIVIPYRYWNSVMRTNKQDLQMGTLRGTVMNQLDAVDKSPKFCHVTLLGCFDNFEAFGTMDRSIILKDIKDGEANVSTYEFIEPQMDTVINLMNAGTKLLSTLNADPNRDLPSMPLQPVSFVPQSMTSMCYMQGVMEPINVLRADPSGTTPHIDVVDEMTIPFIATKQGYLMTIKWDFSMISDAKLMSTKAMPLLDRSDYPSIATPNGLTRTQYTPVAVASNFYCYERGSLIYTIEWIGPRLVTGSFILGIVVGGNNADLNISQLKNGPYQIYDLAEASTIEHVVPWYHVNAWGPVRDFTNGVRGAKFSQLIGRVVTPATGPENVPQYLLGNVYVRAGPDFELAIPRMPILGVPWGEAFLPPKDEYLEPYNLENAWYTTWERNIKFTDGRYATTIYIQNVTDGWVGYLNTQRGSYYELTTLRSGKKFICQYYASKDVLKNIQFAVPDPDIANSNAQGLIMCLDEKSAIAYALGLSKGEDRAALRQKYAIPMIEEGPWSQCFDGTSWTPCTNNGDYPLWIRRIPKAVGQNDEAVTRVSSSTPAKQTSFGLRTFGEETPDFKSLGRRWTTYCTISAQTCSSRSPKDCGYTAEIALHPCRTLDERTSASFDNRSREGTKTLLASCFDGYRGGICLRFVPTGVVPDDIQIIVQHRPDLTCNWQTPIVVYGKGVSTAEDMMCSEYACYMAQMSVNAHAAVSIPWYQMEEYHYLNPRKGNQGLGRLRVWIHSATKTLVDLEVYSKFDDDMRYSNFIGFPLLYTLKDITPEPKPQNPDEVPEPQGDDKGFFSWFTKSKKVVDSADRVLNKVEGIAESCEKLVNNIKNKFSYEEEGQEASEYFGDGIVEGAKRLSKTLFSYMTHLVYVILAPKFSVVCWALFNMYYEFFGFSFGGIESFWDGLKKVWNRCRPHDEDPIQLPQEVEPQLDDDNFGLSLISVIYGGFCSFLGLSVAWNGKDTASIMKGLFVMATGIRSSEYVAKFVSDLIELVKRIFTKVLRYFGFDSVDYSLLSGVDDKRVKNWCAEVLVLTAPEHKQECYKDPSYATKVFELSAFGKALMYTLAASEIKMERVTYDVLVKANKDIQKLASELIERKIYSPIRYEPFCIWIAGKAGLGKSRLASQIAMWLSELEQVNPGYYARVAGQKYFDGYTNQDIIMTDDFCALKVSDDPESYVQFLQMKSCLAFNPPFAHVDEKSKLVNFKTLIITSNKKDFDQAGTHCDEAYNRRRDLLLEIVPSDANKKPREYKDSELKQLAHIKAIRFLDPTNTANGAPTEDIEPVNGKSMLEILRDYIVKEATAYHKRETASYMQRLKEYENIVKKFEASNIDDYLAQYTKLFKEGCSGKIKPEISKWIGKAKEESSYLVTPQGPIDRLKFFDIFSLPSGLPTIVGEVRAGYTLPYEQFKDMMEECQLRADSVLVSPEDYDYEQLYNPTEEVTVKKPGEPCWHTLDLDLWECMVDSANLAYWTPFSNDEVDTPTCRGAPLYPCYYKKRVNDEDIVLIDPECTFHKFFKDDPEYLTRTTMNVWDCWRRKTLKIKTKECDDDSYRGFENEKISKNNYIVRRLKYLALSQSKLAKTVVLIGAIPICMYKLGKLLGLKLGSFAMYIVIKALRIIMTSLIAMGLTYAALQVFKKLHPTEPQLHPSGDYKTLRNQSTMKARALKLVQAQNKEVCPMPKSQLDFIINHINNNFIFITYQLPGFEQNSMRCLGLYGRTVLVPKHYIDYLQHHQVKRVCFSSSRTPVIIEYNLDELEFAWTTQGYGILELPKSFPTQFKNILKYMPNESFDGNYPQDTVILEGFSDGFKLHEVSSQRLKSPLKVPTNGTMSPWTIEHGFRYSWGGSGRCGSLLIAPSMASPLIGIHTSGISTLEGYSELLLRETFETEEPCVEYGDLVLPQLSGLVLDGEYNEVGFVPKDMAVHGATTTRIVPSEIAGVFPIATAPAPLSKKDERIQDGGDPFMVGINHRTNKPLELPKEYKKIILDDISKMLCVNVKPLRNVGELTTSEAIDGLSLPGYDGIVMSTSEGYPWTLMRPDGAANKSWLFKRAENGSGFQTIGIFSDLLDTLKIKRDQRLRGIVPNSFFSACLKDSRIPIEKVCLSSKTRIFEMSPICLTIAQRSCFMDFDVAYQTARFAAENTIGINPDGAEWSKLAKSLIEFSPHLLTADFSKYGPRFPSTVAFLTYDATAIWYAFHMKQQGCTEEEISGLLQMQRVISHEVVKGLHIARDLVMRPSTGIPSGNPETVIRNSLGNSLFIRWAFLALAAIHAPHYCSLYWFYIFVLLYHNGDDLLMAVKEEIIAWFNNQSLISWFAQFDIVMTDAAKSGVVSRSQTIDEATYLKRGFMKHPTRMGEYLAPLEIRSIKDTANWIWKSVNTRQASLVNSEMCVRLAYTRGPEFYQEIVNTITSAWLEKGVYFKAPTWESLDLHIWEGTPGPLFSF